MYRDFGHEDLYCPVCGIPKTLSKTQQTFEEFLIDKHALQYDGLDDDMPDDLDNWLNDLGFNTLMEYSEEWARHIQRGDWDK